MIKYYELNKITNKKKLINSSDIISVGKDYLVIRPSNSNAAAKIIYDYITEDVADNNTNIQLKQDISSMLPEESENGMDRYVYVIGIDSVNVEKRIPYKACGYITSEISVGSCSYIELSVKRNNESASIEYSILDNGNEIPIVPVEQDKITNEKIFPGLPLRFTPTAGSLVIKKDGVETTLTIEEYKSLSNLRYGEGYTADYIPSVGSSKYIPIGDKIKVKIVERCGNSLPSVISSIVINKYGGKKVWNI